MIVLASSLRSVNAKVNRADENSKLQSAIFERQSQIMTYLALELHLVIFRGP